MKMALRRFSKRWLQKFLDSGASLRRSGAARRRLRILLQSAHGATVDALSGGGVPRCDATCHPTLLGLGAAIGCAKQAQSMMTAATSDASAQRPRPLLL